LSKNGQNKYNLRSKGNQENSDQTKDAPIQKGQNVQKSTAIKDNKVLTKSHDKPSLMHALENEINKVKIQFPLLDLMKDKHFQDPIMKLLQDPYENDLIDTINLSDENPTILMGNS